MITEPAASEEDGAHADGYGAAGLRFMEGGTRVVTDEDEAGQEAEMLSLCLLSHRDWNGGEEEGAYCAAPRGGFWRIALQVLLAALRS